MTYTSAIIIPSYNEKENIYILLNKIAREVPDSRIYVVDDQSPDETQDVVRKLMKNIKRLKLITRNSKSGRGGAVLEGLKEAIKDHSTEYFVEMDADLSHSPEEIKKLLEKTKPDTITVGSRYIKESKIIGWPLYRRILSRMANYYIKMVLGVPLTDLTNGFRCYPRNAVEFLTNSNTSQKGFIALSETAYLLHKNNYKFCEIPITFRDREKGKSNATISEVLRSLFAVIQIKLKYDPK